MFLLLPVNSRNAEYQWPRVDGCVQAEEMRGESLGRKGGSELESTQRRALLQMGLAWLMAAGAAQGQEDNQAPPSPPPRNTPDERGQGRAELSPELSA